MLGSFHVFFVDINTTFTIGFASVYRNEKSAFIYKHRPMAKEKSVQKNSPKKVAEKSLMEKRAAKKAKQKSKGKND